MKKSTHYLLKLLVLTLFLNLTNCQNDDINIDKVTTVTNTNNYVVKTVGKQKIFKNKTLLSKLESYTSKNSNKNQSYNRIIHNDSLNIIIDDSNAMFVQNQDSTYHSYTFNALDVNNPDKIVNLLLSLEPDDTYKESILSYQLTESDINLLKQGLEVDFTNKIIYTELNKNTFANTTGSANKIYYSGENCFDISTTVSRCCSNKHTYQDIQNGKICKCSEDEQPGEDFNVIITITSCDTSGGNISNIPDFEYPHDPSNQIDGGAIDYNHQGTTVVNNPNNAALILMFNLDITDTAISDWLMLKKNRGAVESILDFLEDNNYSEEALLLATNAIEVLSVNADANLFLRADCRSFEFAKPPGALQRGCAVSDFDHTFYTAGTRPNGSPYYGEIDVNINIIYFTMPNWMTNGQAANLTAEAVTNATQVTDLYFIQNPDATEYIIADIFRDAIVSQLSIVGGTISLTVEPFPIPNPAPYQTSLLGISDPYDC